MVSFCSSPIVWWNRSTAAWTCGEYSCRAWMAAALGVRRAQVRFPRLAPHLEVPLDLFQPHGLRLRQVQLLMHEFMQGRGVPVLFQKARARPGSDTGGGHAGDQRQHQVSRDEAHEWLSNSVEGASSVATRKSDTSAGR